MNLWRRYPIWEYCLGEEGSPGQDETTIRPSRAGYWQPRDGFDLAEVMGEAQLAKGQIFPAALGITGDRAAYLTVFFSPPSTESRHSWSIRFDHVSGLWRPDADDAADRMFAVKHPGETRPRVSLSDPAVFPLQLRTFAPKQPHTSSHVLTIRHDGSEIEQNA